MAELTHDIMSLVQLQFGLFRKDCRDGLKQLLIPLTMLLLAGIVAAATVPIALIFMAELLVQAAGLSQATAFSIATLSGLLVAAALGLAGWFHLRRAGHVFERSRAGIDPQYDLDRTGFDGAGTKRVRATSGALIFPISVNY